jgi:hypothetical protein
MLLVSILIRGIFSTREINMNTAVLTAAYGRKYSSKEEAIADYNADKDFIMSTITDRWVGRPCNKADLMGSDYDNVKIRFDENREFVFLTLEGIEITNCWSEQ